MKNEGFLRQPEPAAESSGGQAIRISMDLMRRVFAAAGLPRTFIHLARGAQDMGPLHPAIAQAAEKAKVDDTWRYRELNGVHMG
jgi:hypothetical protein